MERNLQIVTNTSDEILKVKEDLLFRIKTISSFTILLVSSEKKESF